MAGPASPASAAPRKVRICRIAGRYLVFDLADVVHLRRYHNISSVFVGTMPQNPTQSIFMSLPIELFAEEAKLLVDQGFGYVVDDAAAHLSKLSALDREGRNAYARALRIRQRELQSVIAEEAARKTAESEMLKRQGRGKRKSSSRQDGEKSAVAIPLPSRPKESGEETLFQPASESPPARSATGGHKSTAIGLTPTTSTGLLDPCSHILAEIAAPPSYPLYAYLNSLGFYMTPGLRFGCDYSVYPGDPFRFHAHFLATSLRWSEDLPMLDLVAGGRLATAVKKSFLIGGQKSVEADRPGSEEVDGGCARSPGGDVRAFCIEWAAM